MFANRNENFTFATVGKNPCRHAHFDFVPGIQGANEESYRARGAAATLSIVQEALDPQSSTAGFNEFGSLDARLETGKTWSLTTRGINESIRVFSNGFATCYSRGPLTEPGS